MRNLTLLTDLYELTMMYGYYRKGMHNTVTVFDVFFRQPRDGSSYAIAAGLEQAVEYVNNLNFDAESIAYLRSLHLFDEEFLEELKSFRFTGEIYAVPEGTVVFPYEPLVRVKARIFEAQLLETALLNFINHQTLIATKASRSKYAAGDADVMEFGLRRAQGPDAGVYGARAAYIGGCCGTSCMLTGQLFGIPVKGTHAHSWVMSFPDELSAFRAYAEIYPTGCLLLVDTYDTLKSGVPNAITVFQELRERGYEPLGIRLDSGDLAYLSREARRMLDEAGFPNAKIFASGDLDEMLIRDLQMQGASIDVWAVGTKLITGGENPALGGVYKLAAEEVDGVLVPKIKLSDNPLKMTNPGYKKIYRIYDANNGMAIADLITMDYEQIDESKPLRLFDPNETWKTMKVTNYRVKELLVPVFVDGKQVYDLPDVDAIQRHCAEDLATFWEAYRRLYNPHVYKVDLSQEVYDTKQALLKAAKGID